MNASHFGGQIELKLVDGSHRTFVVPDRTSVLESRVEELEAKVRGLLDF